MRAVAPTPARMQSCLARIVAVARCCASMQARDVASLVARSSSSACSKIALILLLCQSMVSFSLSQLCQCSLSLFYQDMQFTLTPAYTFHHLRGSLGQKLLIAKLTVSIGQLALQLGHF